MTDQTPEIEQTPLEELTGLLKGQRRRWRRWFGAVLILVLAIGINQVRIEHLGHESQRAADTANQAVRLLIAQRTEARKAACDKDNADADRNNALLDRDKALLAQTFSLPGIKQTAQLDAYLADQYAQYDALRAPLRDCTPAGIEAFYASQGGTLPLPAPDPTSSTTTTETPSTTATRRTTTTTRPTTSTTVRTTTTTTYLSSTAPTAPPTTCAVPITVPGVPCL